MINGFEVLRRMYPNATMDELQPCGLDLRLGQIYSFSGETKYSALYEDKKLLPKLIPKEEDESNNKIGWYLEPNTCYIAEVSTPIHIKSNSTQLYFPRSSLIRAGVHVCGAVGDAGYSGKLSFLIVNFREKNFFLEKNVRFAQLLDFQTITDLNYDGDYQENVQEIEWVLDDYFCIGVGENNCPVTIFGQTWIHDGYLCTTDDRKLHRLIYEHFFGELKPNEVVHHLNHNKLDNRVSNLVKMDKLEHLSYHNKGIYNPSVNNRKYDLPFGFTMMNNLFSFQYFEDNGKRNNISNKRLDILLKKAKQILTDLSKDYSEEIKNIIEWEKSHDIDILSFKKLEKNNLPYRCTLHKKKNRECYEFYENGKYIGGSIDLDKAVKKAIENTSDELYKSYLRKRWVD